MFQSAGQQLLFIISETSSYFPRFFSTFICFLQYDGKAKDIGKLVNFVTTIALAQQKSEQEALKEKFPENKSVVTK